MGIVHITCGIVAFCSAVGLIFNGRKPCFSIATMGIGIWCSVFFTICGILNITGPKNTTSSAAISSLCMSTFCAGTLIVFSALALAGVENPYHRNEVAFISEYLLQLAAGITELILVFNSTIIWCNGEKRNLDTNKCSLKEEQT